MAMTSGPQLDTTVVAPEVASQPAPSTAKAMALDVGRTEGDSTEGSLDIMVAAERTNRESSLALTSGGSNSPTRGDPLLRWTNPEDWCRRTSPSMTPPRAWSGFVAQTGISLLGEVNQIHVLVDNQRSCGAKIVGFNLSI